MPANKPAEVVGKMVDMLRPYPSVERHQMVSATMTLLGETAVVETPRPRTGGSNGADEDAAGEFPAKAKVWMKQNGITAEQLQHVFHFSGAGVEIIAPDFPGKNKKQKTYNAYVLEGIAQLLATGEPHFTDKVARALCERAGCFDSANHATHMNNKGNEFAGSKDKGWTLTAPGLKKGAALVKELSQQNG